MPIEINQTGEPLEIFEQIRTKDFLLAHMKKKFREAKNIVMRKEKKRDLKKMSKHASMMFRH